MLLCPSLFSSYHHWMYNPSLISHTGRLKLWVVFWVSFLKFFFQKCVLGSCYAVLCAWSILPSFPLSSWAVFSFHLFLLVPDYQFSCLSNYFLLSFSKCTSLLLDICFSLVSQGSTACIRMSVRSTEMIWQMSSLLHYQGVY